MARKRRSVSLATGSPISTRLFGVGLTVAEFLDATLVRMVLVPAAMSLVGNANWWLSPARIVTLGIVLPGGGTMRVPLATADASPEFVTEALREGGALSADAGAVRVDHEQLAEGVGFVGQLARLG